MGIHTRVASAKLPLKIMAATDVKLFNKYSFDDVQVSDMALTDYIAAKSNAAVFLPHSAGRWSKKRFKKAQCPIVERITNSLMMHGRNNGKKVLAVRIMKHTCEIIHLLTGENPIQVIVDAVVNSGAREDSCRIGSAGVVRRQAIDVSPLRRVNMAIWLLTTGAREAASATSRPSPSASPRSSSTPPRVPPTATPSRRRTRSSAWLRPTGKRVRSCRSCAHLIRKTLLIQ